MYYVLPIPGNENVKLLLTIHTQAGEYRNYMLILKACLEAKGFLLTLPPSLCSQTDRQTDRQTDIQTD